MSRFGFSCAGPGRGAAGWGGSQSVHYGYISQSHKQSAVYLLPLPLPLPLD